MKRLLLFTAMFLCCMATSFAQFSGSGSGTESDPYLILNPIQLNQMRNFLNKSGVYFKLMADIDLTEFLEDENPDQGWQPVGTSSAPFKGVLDGNGKRVSGLWINRSSSDYVGFFGCTNGATIKNLALSCNSVKGNKNVGVLSAHSTSTTMSDCTLSGSVIGTSYVGGCIGWGKSNVISSVFSTVEVTCSGDYVGGVIGYVDGEISISESRVICNSILGANYVGGICGSNIGKISLTNCYVQANIKGGDYVGGAYGQVFTSYENFVINKCGFIGDIEASSNAGGICGELKGGGSGSRVTNCYAVGNIVANGNNVGGIVGASLTYETSTYYISQRQYYFFYYMHDILNSYFCGSISATEQIGGIVGYKLGGTINYCYSKGTFTGINIVGGLCGKIDGERRRALKKSR